MAEELTERIISAEADNLDGVLDNTLRPRTLEEYIGQEAVKDNLKIFMAAAKTGASPWNMF